jgi:hypothetical protein
VTLISSRPSVPTILIADAGAEPAPTSAMVSSADRETSFRPDLGDIPDKRRSRRSIDFRPTLLGLVVAAQAA